MTATVMVQDKYLTGGVMLVVCGAGGFIGGYIVKSLIAAGESVRAIDIKPLSSWYQLSAEAENIQADLSLREPCHELLSQASAVYNLACDMGGIGFIENNKAECMLNVLINTHLLKAAQYHGVGRYFFASSACVYAASKQDTPAVRALREEDAYPAMPEDGYGWEKLFSERMCRHFSEDFGIETRVARFHNIYGPHGAYGGGREKAPAAICRKVIAAQISGQRHLEIWGDGKQTRSFTYIDDCVAGVEMLMKSSVSDPINLGSSEVVTIDELVNIVEDIAGTKLIRRYQPSAPLGVAGRNSDNTLIRRHFGWEPSTPLRVGLEKTYRWIYGEMLKTHESAARVGEAERPEQRGTIPIRS